LQPNNISKKLIGVQTLRALAALLVLVQHSYYFSGLALNIDPMYFLKFELGTIGVYVFFIISGYIIYKKIDSQFLDFIFKRITRIYPTYFLTMALSFLLFWLFSRENLPVLTNDLSQLLLPTGNLNGSFQIPYWSLIYEVFFYGIFSLSLLGSTRNPRRTLLIICAIWTALILYSLFFVKAEIPPANPTFRQIFFSKQNLYFIAGILLSMSDEEKPYYLLIYGLILSVISTTPFGSGLRYDLNIMLLGTLAVVILEKLSKYIPALLVRIGDWSYGIYLLHLPIVYILYKSLTGRIINQGQGFLIMFTIALGVSTLYGYLDNILYHNIFNKLVSRILVNNKIEK
jgi:peptidoglycan/LPS O-acetylase OafA/YrhL